jgi:type II secretory pathway component PulF
MSTWKYQSVLPDGVSVYGMLEAASESALREYLAARGQTLVAATELSINASLVRDSRLPRLLRLRLGDRIREALLTGLPADQAVRALADEPIEHPLQMLAPWLMASTTAVAGAFALAGVMLPEHQQSLIRVAGAILLATVLSGVILRWCIVQRPRRTLRWLAERLERGEVDALKSSGVLPHEVRELLNSTGDERSRYCSAAELIPELSSMRMGGHQLALGLVGPLILFSLMIMVLYVATYLIVPMFAEIFRSFGISLPWLTEQVLSLGRFVAVLGWGGILGLATVLAGMCAVVYAMLAVPRASETLDHVPLLGLSLRWQMQARVSRVLSVLLRNEAAPEQAIVLASSASGSPAAAADGQAVAQSLRTHGEVRVDPRRLSGLPLAMLSASRREGEGQPNHQTQAQLFELYASSLEQASRGNMALLAVVVEMLLIMIVGSFSLILVVGLLLPMITLLRDLIGFV